MDLRLACDFYKALDECGGNLSRVARSYGIARETLLVWKGHHEAGHVWARNHWHPAGMHVEAQEEAPLALRLKALLKRHEKNTVASLADALDVSPRRVTEALDELQGQGVLVELAGGSVYLERDLPLVEAPVVIDFKKYREVEYPFGVVADNHLGSKYERQDVLECLFDRFQSYGVETVFQCGNIIDGEARFNKFDIYVHGVEDQVQNLIEKWPRRPGMTTRFVTGDDHEGWYVQREHIDIGGHIEACALKAGREDLVHLGYMERNLLMEQEGGSSTIRLIHAGGGSAYAVSYTSQKYAESIQGGEKPQIVLVGHFHKFAWDYPRNIHIIQAACTQDQTPFMRKRRIEAHVGGVVLWVKQNELGIFTSVKAEWLPFYNKTFYYNW